MRTYSLELISHLSRFVTENRLNLINTILERRTRYITVVLEDIFQPQNASAVLRSCDCFGIQDVHIIENENEYKINRDVSLGSNQWLNLHYYNHAAFNTTDALKALKENGYRLVATSPLPHHVPLKEFDLGKGKCAFLFGTELTGLSNTALELADESITIPMYGFTESFNISVSAALILYEMREALENSSLDWHLSEKEKAALKLEWLRNSIKKPKLIEKEFKKNFNK